MGIVPLVLHCERWLSLENHLHSERPKTPHPIRHDLVFFRLSEYSYGDSHPRNREGF